MTVIRRFAGPAALLAAIFAADRVTKWLAMRYLAGTVAVCPLFHLTYVENTGAAFGLFKNGNAVLAVLSAAALCALFIWRDNISRYGLAARYGMLFVAGGTLGNLYDRMVLGRVIDFLDFRVWPVFNVADSFISVGAALAGWVFCFKPGGNGKSLKEGGI